MRYLAIICLLLSSVIFSESGGYTDPWYAGVFLLSAGATLAAISAIRRHKRKQRKKKEDPFNWIKERKDIP